MREFLNYICLVNVIIELRLNIRMSAIDWIIVSGYSSSLDVVLHYNMQF